MLQFQELQDKSTSNEVFLPHSLGVGVPWAGCAHPWRITAAPRLSLSLGSGNYSLPLSLQA